MKPRSAIEHYYVTRQRWTLHVGCQGVFGLRNYVAGVLGIDRNKIRILTERVGRSTATGISKRSGSLASAISAQPTARPALLRAIQSETRSAFTERC